MLSWFLQTLSPPRVYGDPLCSHSVTVMCNLVVRNTVVSLETETRFTVPLCVRQSVWVSMCGIMKYTTSFIKKKAQSVLFCVSCSYIGVYLGRVFYFVQKMSPCSQ